MTRLRMLTALVAVTALWAPPARAAVGVSPTADTTWGTEIADTGKAGRVLTVAVSGGVVYPGGGFLGLSPPRAEETTPPLQSQHVAAPCHGRPDPPPRKPHPRTQRHGPLVGPHPPRL